MSANSAPGGCRLCRLVVDVSLTVLVLGLVGAAWWWTHRQPDMVAVLHANNRGVGHMERFEYEKAAAAFQECVAMAPNWRPGRVNLGIALLNTADEKNLDRAVQIFRDILKEDPDDPYAHYCLGIILQYRKQPDEVAPHFEAVTRIDPSDASAWFKLGSSLPPESPRAKECYERAVELDPYLTAALHGLGLACMRTDPDKGRALLDRMEALRQARWTDAMDLKYGSMGRYANVIGAPARPEPPRAGPLPAFQPRDDCHADLAPGARWAKAADFGEDPVGRLRARARERFGSAMVVLDYDGDGRLDLFLVGAVVDGGRVRDLLLHNEGGGQFRDVTAQSGLAGPRPSLGCCVADFDNDGKPDLLITGAGQQKLFRNTGKGGFEDVTARAGLDRLDTICLGACFVDLDQDGDLDLLLACHAPNADEAVKALKGQKAATGRVEVLLNIGEAPPQKKGEARAAGLTCRWKRADGLKAFSAAGQLTGFVVLDIDADGDLDVLLLRGDGPGSIVRNDRLLRFTTGPAPAQATGGLALDSAHAGRSDLFLIGPKGEAKLLLCRQGRAGDLAFQPAPLRAPPLLQSSALDVNLDGWTDVVALTSDGRVVVLVNEAGRFAARFVPGVADVVAVAPLVTREEGGRVVPKLAVWSREKGLVLLGPTKLSGHALAVRPDGRRGVEPGGAVVRTNADGIGVRVMAQAGGLWTGVENTTLSAGLGQSRQPLLLGLRQHGRADVVRLRWPDGTIQAELDWPAGLARIRQSNRKRTSCPVLFAWDGQRFGFVNDLLGAGSLGELLPDGTTRPPRGEESLKIEPGQLAPRDGKYRLDLAEPMDEITYLDQLQLVVIDHPAAMNVYPDERFATGGRPPTQALIAFEKRLFPVKAADHRGRDVTQVLAAWDRRTVAGFRRRAWLGFAEEHFVTLDFGGQLEGLKRGERTFLCLAGWTDYPYPESIWAATQAGVAMLPPVLEQEDGRGGWRKVCDVGFPAGLPRLMLREVSGKLEGTGRLRLRGNLQVYWDQVFLATGCQEVERAITLPVARAELRPCGLHREYSPDGKPPTLYDHDRFDRDPVLRPAGRLTRHGDVTELLQQGDDRFVIFGPGDLLRVEFDASKLPALPAGWKRGFVLRARGYCKDVSPFTACGATVGPLPFRAMRNYPPGKGEQYPDTPAHRAYLRRYQTRVVGPEQLRPPAGPRRPADRSGRIPGRTR